MRTFYIFKINTILNPIYKTNKTVVFKILSNINKYSSKDYKLAKRIYHKIIISIDKDKINNYILNMHLNDIYYKKELNRHILDSSLEKSILTINNTYIKIQTSNNISSFFKDLIPICNDMFCVDFKSIDYFYLKDLGTKVLV